MRQIVVVTLEFALLFEVVAGHSHSSAYFDMVNDVALGKNYYELLNVPKTATVQEIKRSFRKLALDYHPDKTIESKSFTKEEIQARYHLLIRANEVLTDEQKRAELDDLLNNGIPWQDKYYGRYAHQFGAPVHDVRYVIAAFIGIITLLQYAYKWYRYYFYLDLVKTRMIQSGKKVSGDIVVYGAQKPKLQEIFIVQLFFFPYHLYKFLLNFVYWVSGKGSWGMSKEEWEQSQMKKYGMTQKEWERETKLAEERAQSFKQGAKYKQMKRWLKNR